MMNRRLSRRHHNRATRRVGLGLVPVDGRTGPVRM